MCVDHAVPLNIQESSKSKDMENRRRLWFPYEVLCSDCSPYRIATSNFPWASIIAINAYQKIRLKEIRYVLTKVLEKYNVHDKLFVKHLVTLQAKLLHMNPNNVKL